MRVAACEGASMESQGIAVFVNSYAARVLSEVFRGAITMTP